MIEPERALQVWDDLDDLVGALALRAERIRQHVLFAIATLVFASLVFAGILLAVAEPPLALAIVVLLLVTLMYRAVTGRQRLEISA
jgi:hypothetical protein